MSDSEDGSEKSVKDEGEVREEVERKCLEAFMEFDEEGSGAIASD